MTEEIIIDGVNISECCFYNNGKCDNPNGMACNCINNAVCYFKELKRLEQENKELKEMLSKEPKAMQAFQISYSGLKRDNEILWGMVKDYKTALEEIKTIINQPCDNCKYNKDDITCSIGDCGEGKLKIIENRVNEVLNDI